MEVCAREIILGYFREMISHKAGAIVGVEIEFVYNMRVASRRLRAAMDNFAVCFNSDQFTQLYKNVKTITRILGAVRDLDVLIVHFQNEMSTLSTTEQQDIQGLIEHLQQKREKARKPMLALFTTLDTEDFGNQFLTFFEVDK